MTVALYPLIFNSVLVCSYTVIATLAISSSSPFFFLKKKQSASKVEVKTPYSPSDLVTMTASKSPTSFVRSIRKVYSPIGFQKGYNFTLWFVFGGALLGFTLARLQYLAVDTVFAKSAAPGEWYWMRQGRYKIGIALHLGTILPAALLALIQVR